MPFTDVSLEMAMTDHAGPLEPALSGAPARPRRAPFWLNGALTGVVLTSVLVAALDHAGQPPNPVDDIAWILILLLCTSLVRGYAAFVSGRAPWEPNRSRARSILRSEWPLLVSGTPAVLILLAGLQARWPAVSAIHAVLFADVAILLGLGIVGANKAGYPPRWAVLIGIADAVLGVLVIVANIFLR